MADFTDAEAERLAAFLEHGWSGCHPQPVSARAVEDARTLLRFIFEGRRQDAG